MDERVERFCDWAECLLNHRDPGSQKVRGFGALSVVVRAADNQGLAGAVQDLGGAGLGSVIEPAMHFLGSQGDDNAASVLAEAWGAQQQKSRGSQESGDRSGHLDGIDARWVKALPASRFAALAEHMMRETEWPG